jgi:hypothetical protein
MERIEVSAVDIQKQTFIQKLSSQTEEHNTIYGRKVELSMWTGLIRLRMFVSDGIYNIQFAEEVADLFQSVNS